MTTFADSNAWTITDKGVFGKARDSSYKEKVREGVPIEYFFEIEHQKYECESVIKTDSMTCYPCKREYVDTDYRCIETRKLGKMKPKKKQSFTYVPKANKYPSRLRRGKIRCIDIHRWEKIYDSHPPSRDIFLYPLCKYPTDDYDLEECEYYEFLCMSMLNEQEYEYYSDTETGRIPASDYNWDGHM